MATQDRKAIDPGEGIPSNPSGQWQLLTNTDNGWHDLDPPEDEQPDQGKPRLKVDAVVSIQEQFLQSCKVALGYVESGGKSKYGIWYGDRPEVKDSGFDSAPWCDMFLAERTYKLLGDAGLKKVGMYALTTAHAAYLHKKGVTSRPGTLPPGAFAFQNWDLNGVGNGNLYKIDHVEVVETDHGDGTATFVGGNVDNGVRRRRRSKAYLVVVAEWWKLIDYVPASVASDDWYAVPGSRS